MNSDNPSASVIVTCVEPDPTPAVRALARAIQQRLQDPAFAQAALHLSGSFTFRASHDLSGMSLSFDRGAISIRRGQIDNAPDSPGADVSHWVARLEEPLDETWTEAAARYWALAERLPGAPRSLLLRCLNGSEELRLGDADGDAYEIHGDRENLHQVLSGEVLLIDAASSGRVKVVGTLPELSVLSGACMEMLIGEWR